MSTTTIDPAPIRLVLNGTERKCPGGTSVRGLIESLGLRPELVVAEVNRVILDRNRYAHEMLADGDSVELVHFVGGG